MNKIATILVCVLVLAGVAFLFRNQISTLFFGDMGTKITDPHVRLLNDNPSYQKADNLRAAGGDPAEVVKLYQQALQAATDPAERGQIQFKIASTSVRIDTDASIEQLKELIADPAQSDIQRAYAAQQLGQTYYRNTDKDIVSAIFSGEPYAGFYAEKDIRLALRRLFEYASSFYPLAISELRAARWYADEVYTLKQKETLTQDEQTQLDLYLSIIRENLTLAEVDIERTKDAPNAKRLIPNALARKAGVLGALSLAGEESFASPDEAFQTAINANILGKDDGPPRVAYARYLLDKYGESRKNDIIALLAPLTLDIEKYPDATKIYLGAERNNALGQKKSFIKLAALIPNFKKMLIILGWKETDFAL